MYLDSLHGGKFLMSDKDLNKKKWKPGQAYPNTELKRIRTAKGDRPYFFEDPNVDKLLAMVLALASELSAVRDRLDTHERLAEKKEWSSHEAIEGFKIDEETSSYRNQSREEFISRIMRIMKIELDNINPEETEKNYQDIIKEMSE